MRVKKYEFQKAHWEDLTGWERVNSWVSFTDVQRGDECSGDSNDVVVVAF